MLPTWLFFLQMFPPPFVVVFIQLFLHSLSFFLMLRPKFLYPLCLREMKIFKFMHNWTKFYWKKKTATFKIIIINSLLIFFKKNILPWSSLGINLLSAPCTNWRGMLIVAYMFQNISMWRLLALYALWVKLHAYSSMVKLIWINCMLK